MGQERLGPSYFFISLVLGPLNSLLWYVPSQGIYGARLLFFVSARTNKRHHHQYKLQGGNELPAFLCNTLEQHGEQPGNVLCRAGLADAEWNEPASVTILFMAAQKHFPSSVPIDTDDDDDNVALPQPMNRMIGPEYPSCLWGARTP